ncbi:serine/threonine-protein kinase [Candidatus Uabimicrobium sp. HlEnr_7]|uniref:serine/threonine-protein kinase n=1 Tax=Candidatus Uabimicrobium helgolandensis TaxID=3095367 RepID=UPI003557A699
MNSNLQNTWKTIVANATIEDAGHTYKTRGLIEKTSFVDLPTLTVKSRNTEGKIEKIELPEIIDHAAATEAFGVKDNDREFTVGKEAKNNAPDDTLPTVKDKEQIKIDDELYPTVTNEQFDSEISKANEDTIVSPLTVNDNNKVIHTPQMQPNSFSTLEIHNEIARGGMGVVLKGQQNSLMRDIAIKKLLDNDETENDVEEKKKFVMEARVTAFLDHPNIIPIHELGVDHDGNPLITMKLVRGKSWKQILNNYKPEKYCPEYISEQLGILINICNALSYAHNKNIIHSDLKPANIMVGEFGEVFVMDWGIAVTTDLDSTITMHKSMITSPMGTPHYMAPELAAGEGEKIGPWTDTYLLGAILYRILMGKPPHTGSNLWACIHLASEGNIPPFRDDIPGELVNICTKAIQKNPQDRYTSMNDFKKAIQEFSEHWESIQITDESYNFLQFGKKIFQEFQEKSRAEVLKEYPNPYCPISRSLFGFNEALRIWSENPKAIAGSKEGMILYFKMGLVNKNYELCCFVIGKSKNHFGYDTTELEAELAQHQETEDLGQENTPSKTNSELAYRETTLAFDPELAYAQTKRIEKLEMQKDNRDYGKLVITVAAIFVGIIIGKLL